MDLLTLRQEDRVVAADPAEINWFPARSRPTLF
jgi:hypothetical protein